MTVARALYAFTSETDGDLSFREDEIIRVLQQDDSGWWVGQTDDGRRGEFPFNYVEIIDANAAERIKTGARFVSTSNNAGGPVDKVTGVTVIPIPSSPSFTVEATMSRKKVKAVKTAADFRTLDEQLRYLYPDFDRPLPPMWADKIFESETASAKRAKVLQIYLQKLVGSSVEVTEYALISWLNPREEFNCSKDAKSSVHDAQGSASKNNGGRNSQGEALASVTPLAKAEYKWEASDAVELPLFKGTLVAVRSKNTLSPGWWEGETSDGQRGLFPMNYVVMLSSQEARQVITGGAGGSSRAKPSGGAPTSVQPVEMQTKNVVKRKPANRQRKTENNFAIPTLDAFDELLQDGFTMLANRKVLIPRKDAVTPKEGDQVTLSYVGYVWDCQKQRIIEFASSDLPDKNDFVGPLMFTVGGGQTIKALERAVLNLEHGQASRIIVKPDMGYGEVGNPPSVPPNCHLVYDVTLDDFSSGGMSSSNLPVGGAVGGNSNSLEEAYGQAAMPGLNAGPVGNRQKRPNHPRETNVPEYVYEDNSSSPKYSLAEMRVIVNGKQYKSKGVNPAFLEDQLNDEAFQDAFDCSRAEFMLMPKWKRNKLKKDADLY